MSQAYRSNVLYAARLELAEAEEALDVARAYLAPIQHTFGPVTAAAFKAYGQAVNERARARAQLVDAEQFANE